MAKRPRKPKPTAEITPEDKPVEKLIAEPEPLPTPDPDRNGPLEKPQRREPKSWAELVRSTKTFVDTGMKHATFKVPYGNGILERVGIRFADDWPPDNYEKKYIEHDIKEKYGANKGMEYWAGDGIKTWGMKLNEENIAITQEVAEYLNARRLALGKPEERER